MTDDTDDAFGTFPQGPTFEEVQKANEAQATIPAASPKRRSRRSKAAPATPTAPSSPGPKRKYTRKAPAAAIDKVAKTIPPFVPLPPQGSQSELDLVTDIVTRLRALDAKTRARVTAAIGKLL